MTEGVLGGEARHPETRFPRVGRNGERLLRGGRVHRGLAGRGLGSSRYFYLRRVLVLNFHIILIFSDN